MPNQLDVEPSAASASPANETPAARSPECRAQPFAVAALYRFTAVEKPQSVADTAEAMCRQHSVLGTLLVAAEGINGTIAGSYDAIEAVVTFLKSLPDFAELDVKRSTAGAMPFRRLKIRVKREIVTMGVEGVDPRAVVGTYVAPRDWNALISNPETLVIDTRNDYETAIGTFRGAIDPETEMFRDFPAWAEANLSDARDRPIAMFCTGGIRCEKATALLKARGFDNVFHLKGGILKYLEDVPASESLWQGDCFVFDRRVSVGHGLVQGPHHLCGDCGWPVPAPPGSTGGGFVDGPCDRCEDTHAKPAGPKTTA